MSTEEILDERENETDSERLNRLEQKIDYILSAIVLRQKEACELAGITQATAINMALRGDLEPLQADGGKAAYLTLERTAKLKPRRKSKKRKF